jgi:DNA-binding GntR family transcriptional regulator
MERKQSRADLVCNALRKAVLEQAVEPGTKLSEDVIAGRLAVSRTGARAALRHLRGDVLIGLQAGKGACVAEPTAGDAREIVLRYSLILARSARDHSPQYAIDAHERIIAAQQAGNAETAEELMLHHLESIAMHADPRATPSRNDTASILSHHAARRGSPSASS